MALGGATAAPRWGLDLKQPEIGSIQLEDVGDGGEAWRNGRGPRDSRGRDRSMQCVIEGMVLVAILIDALKRLVAGLGELRLADLVLLRLLARARGAS